MKTKIRMNGIVRVLVVVLALLGAASAQKTPPAHGRAKLFSNEVAVGQWRMNETAGTIAFDSSLNQNHGTVTGDAALEPDAQMGGVLRLRKGGLVIPHHPDLEPQEGTVVVLVKLARRQDADVFYKLTDGFVNTGFEGKRQVYGIRVHERGDTSACIANDDPESSSPWVCAYTRMRLQPGQWHALALRWDGQHLTLFTDGTARAIAQYKPVAGLGLSYRGENPLLVGVGGLWGSPGSKDFAGDMSNLMVFDRALSDQEISELSQIPN